MFWFKKNVYDLIIIGGGSAGLSAAEISTIFGKKVALVSENIGGDCLWTGCIPSKALIHAAKNSRTYQQAKIQVENAVKTVQSQKDNPDYYRKLGIDVYLSRAEFIDKHSIKLHKKESVEGDDLILKSKYFLIATGSRPAKVPIQGMDKVEYITNEEVFSLKKLPKSLFVLGGGPIGCELAQTFTRLGSKVTIIQRNERLLPKDEPEASALIKKVFEKEGIRIYLNTNTDRVAKNGDKIELTISTATEKQTLTADSLLVAAGRTPNIENLNLEKIGVKLNKKGVEHNEYLQTAIPHIYVSGDITGDFLFTHYAGVQAAAAVRNIFIPFKKRFTPKVVPWCTFTDPEVAHVGLTKEQATLKDLEFRVLNLEFKDIDRAVSDDQKDGFIKLLVDNKNHLIGATIVGNRAGEIIHELAVAMENNLPTNKLLSMIHIYPTYSSGIQKILLKDLLENNSKTKKLAKIFSKFS